MHGLRVAQQSCRSSFRSILWQFFSVYLLVGDCSSGGYITGSRWMDFGAKIRKKERQNKYPPCIHKMKIILYSIWKREVCKQKGEDGKKNGNWLRQRKQLQTRNYKRKWTYLKHPSLWLKAYNQWKDGMISNEKMSWENRNIWTLGKEMMR